LVNAWVRFIEVSAASGRTDSSLHPLLQQTASAKMTSPKIQISRSSDCVVKIEYPDDCLVTIGMARQITCELQERFGNQPFAIVHVAGKLTGIDDGIREYLSSLSRKQSKIAEAFVIRNLSQRILANFYVRVLRPGCPSEVFEREDEAVKWVQMYCKN
jgi:hypothetical protein